MTNYLKKKNWEKWEIQLANDEWRSRATESNFELLKATLNKNNGDLIRALILTELTNLQICAVVGQMRKEKAAQILEPFIQDAMSDLKNPETEVSSDDEDEDSAERNRNARRSQERVDETRKMLESLGIKFSTPDQVAVGPAISGGTLLSEYNDETYVPETTVVGDEEYSTVYNAAESSYEGSTVAGASYEGSSVAGTATMVTQGADSDDGTDVVMASSTVIDTNRDKKSKKFPTSKDVGNLDDLQDEDFLEVLKEVDSSMDNPMFLNLKSSSTFNDDDPELEKQRRQNEWEARFEIPRVTQYDKTKTLSKLIGKPIGIPEKNKDRIKLGIPAKPKFKDYAEDFGISSSSIASSAGIKTVLGGGTSVFSFGGASSSMDTSDASTVVNKNSDSCLIKVPNFKTSGAIKSAGNFRDFFKLSGGKTTSDSGSDSSSDSDSSSSSDSD